MEGEVNPASARPLPEPTLFSSGPRCTLSFIRRETLHRTPIRFTAAMDSQLVEYVAAGLEAEQNKQRASQHPRDAPPPDFSTSLLELQPYSSAFPLDPRSIQSYHLINRCRSLGCDRALWPSRLSTPSCRACCRWWTSVRPAAAGRSLTVCHR